MERDGARADRSADGLAVLLLVMYTDPKTVAWLESCFDPVFGFPNVARFSWQPVKNALAKKGAKVKWFVSSSLLGRCSIQVPPGLFAHP